MTFYNAFTHGMTPLPTPPDPHLWERTQAFNRAFQYSARNGTSVAELQAAIDAIAIGFASL